MGYKDDLAIDKHGLDKEWLKQPLVFAKWAEKSADANRDAKQADEKLKTIRSEIVLSAKEQGAKTQQQIEALYRTNPAYKEAKNNMLQKQHEAEIHQNAVMAFHQKKAALDHLSKLHGMNYFSTPEKPADLDEDALRDSTNNRMARGRATRGRKRE